MTWAWTNLGHDGQPTHSQGESRTVPVEYCRLYASSSADSEGVIVIAAHVGPGLVGVQASLDAT